MMTPEQKFTRWVRGSITFFIFLFTWFIIADIWIPLTADATVMRAVTPVSSRVSGYVVRVYVDNNSQVKKGDLLYELDSTPFINKVKAAQIALEQAKLSNKQLDAQIIAARASLLTAQYTARNDKVTLDRYQRLSTTQNVSRSDLDRVRTTWKSSAQSVLVLNASIQELLIQRGERDDSRNVLLQKYRNTLEEALFNLGWSKVYAETEGIVSNLQLSPGLYATAAMPLMALVRIPTDIVADFREKSLRHTVAGTPAVVAFDAIPGKVFLAHVSSQDAGILAGQEVANGQLSQPEQSTRWVRDAQKMRIHVTLDEPLTQQLPTGARATVQLYNSDNQFARYIAGLQINLVSLLHYVY
ncbi:MAG: HlyD family secretion protein [Shewanella oncorhynchi]